MRLNPATVRKMATPGKKATQGAVSITSVLSRMMLPQPGSGTPVLVGSHDHVLEAGVYGAHLSHREHPDGRPILLDHAECLTPRLA